MAGSSGGFPLFPWFCRPRRLQLPLLSTQTLRSRPRPHPRAPTCGCQCISFRSCCPPCTNSSWGGRLSGARALVSGASAASSSAGRAGATGQGRAGQAAGEPAAVERMPPSAEHTHSARRSQSTRSSHSPCSKHTTRSRSGGKTAAEGGEGERTWVPLQRQVPHRQLVVCGCGGQHGALVGAPLNRRDWAPADTGRHAETGRQPGSQAQSQTQAARHAVNHGPGMQSPDSACTLQAPQHRSPPPAHRPPPPTHRRPPAAPVVSEVGHR